MASASNKMDLTWTGNQFLDQQHSLAVHMSAAQIDYTTKDDVWSETLAQEIEKYCDLPKNYVRVAAGATQLIEACLRALYRAQIVDVIPNFHLTATLARQEKWNYVSVPVRFPEELEPALTPYFEQEDTLIVLSSPRNPICYQFPLDILRRVAKHCKGYLIVDEVYADFASHSMLDFLQQHPNVIVMRTFSKAWGLANLRVGYAASAMFAEKKTALHLIPNAVAGVSQRAARFVLQHPEAVRVSIAQTRACTQEFIKQFQQIEGMFVWPSDANYICVETPHAHVLAKVLDELGYKVRELHDLKGYPAEWPQGLRITTPPQKDIDVIMQCIRSSLKQIGKP